MRSGRRRFRVLQHNVYLAGIYESWFFLKKLLSRTGSGSVRDNNFRKKSCLLWKQEAQDRRQNSTKKLPARQKHVTPSSAPARQRRAGTARLAALKNSGGGCLRNVSFRRSKAPSKHSFCLRGVGISVSLGDTWNHHTFRQVLYLCHGPKV